MSCYFYYSSSTSYFDLNTIGLDGAFHELSNYIKFVKFGLVDLKLFDFEKSICKEFEFKELNQI
jgi:hypothetical protein